MTAENTAHPGVQLETETRLPTRFGEFDVRAYTDLATGDVHLAISSGELRDGAIVRLHSECLTGEAFGSLKCECGPQLDASLERIARDGGAVIYLRGHEGRGIGLVAKLHAYRLQEAGLDTVDANTAQGLPVDARSYAGAAAILRDLGLREVRLLTNNPEKITALDSDGIRVLERIPLIVGQVPENAEYLATKANRMGHLLAADTARERAVGEVTAGERAERSANTPNPA